MYQAPEAPLSVAGVLDDGFLLFRAAFKDAFPLSFGGALLSAPLRAELWSAASLDVRAIPGLLLSLVLLAALGLITTGGVLARIAAVAGGDRLSLAGALALALRRLPAMIGAAVASSFTILVGLLALVLPGVYLAVALMFALVAVVVERCGPIASLRRSSELVRGHWGHAAGAATLMGIVAIVHLLISLGITVAWLDPASVAAGAEGAPWYVDYVLDPSISGVFGAFLYSLLVALYRDLVRRTEQGGAAQAASAVRA